MALEQRLAKEIGIHRAWILDTQPEGVIPSDDYEFLLHAPDDGFCSAEMDDSFFNALLPLARKMVSDYRDHIGCLDSSGQEPQISCVLCPDSKALRGWEALIIHLKNYWKKRVAQHRAFLRALKEALRAEVESLRQEAGSHSWQPVLLVDNVGDDGKPRRFRGLQGEEISHKLSELQIHEVLAVYSRGGNPAESRIVVPYPASEVDFVDAKQLQLRDHEPVAGAAQERKPVEDEQLDTEQREDVSEQDEAIAMKNSFRGLLRRQVSTVDWQAGHADASDGDDASGDEHQFYADKLLLFETQQCDYLREKWSRSFEAAKQLKIVPKPFKKSRKMKDMENKVHKDLKTLDNLNVDARLKMRLQLEEVEKHLKKERLAWLKTIDAVEPQFDSNRKQDVANKFDKDVKLMNFVKQRLLSKEQDENDPLENEDKALEVLGVVMKQ